MKNLLKHQEGITFIGILVILGMLGCFFLFGLRAFPLYTEHFAIKQAMKGVAAQPYKSRNSITRVRSLLLKNLDINHVYTFNDKNIDNIKVTSIMNKSFKFMLNKNQDEARKLVKKFNITLIPVVSKNLKIKSVIRLKDII